MLPTPNTPIYVIICYNVSLCMCAGGVQPAPVQAPDGEDRGDLPHLPLRAARHPPLPRLQHPQVTLKNI